MEDKKYNGWTNYETWCVHLWLSNEEGSYLFCRDLAKEGTTEEAAAALKDYVEEAKDEGVPSTCMFSNLLGAALSEVDWYEIAEAFKE